MASRFPMAVLPTPLHRATRLSDVLGREVWLKRDDLTGVGLGGNKVRKMELLASDALGRGADTLVGVGAGQSNHARTVAATAAMLGMPCHLVMGGGAPAQLTGNLLLSDLFGARFHFVDSEDWGALDEAAIAVAARVESEGGRPYVIPVGGSVPLGALAFAAAYIEFDDQCRSAGLHPVAVVHASSSAGTQAGLEVGRHLAASGTAIVGVDVARITGSLATEVRRLADAAAAIVGLEATFQPTVLSGYLGDGYGIPSEGATRAGRLLARTEGVVVDPVYTAKALQAVCEEPFDPVVFWHTGGTPAVFAEPVPYER